MIETVRIAELSVDEELLAKVKLPGVSEEVKAQLKAKIEAEGVREPLTVWRGRNVVVDGVTRLAIYKDLELQDCLVTYRDFEDEQAAAQFRVTHNLYRRQLNLWQQCRLALEVYVLGNLPKRANGNGSKWADAAKLSGANEKTLQQAEYIINNIHSRFEKPVADTHLDRLEAGTARIHGVWSDIKKTNARDAQAGNSKKKTNGEPPTPIVLPKPPRHDGVDNRILHSDWVDAIKQIPDGAVTLYVFSPPYLNAKFSYGGIFNDLASYQSYLEWLKMGMKEIPRTLRQGGMVAINTDNITSRLDERNEGYRYPVNADIANIFREAGLNYFDEIVWRKNISPGNRPTVGSFGTFRFRRVHEYIVLGSKGEANLPNLEDGKIDITPQERGTYTQSVWTLPSEKHDNEVNHPCPFHPELPRRLIKLFSFQGDLVVDCFVGTGTTAVVAKQLGRRYYGCDLNAKFAAYAQERVESASCIYKQQSVPQDTLLLCSPIGSNMPIIPQ